MMEHWQRIRAAFVITVIAVGVLVVFDMFYPGDIGSVIFSPQFVALVFGVGYVCAPYVLRFFKYK
jgi:hypothetical protein